jgi:DNA ligase-1
MFKPMLAATLEEPFALKYPVLVSRKLDGIRATVQDGKVLSRSLKEIPNRHVQQLFSHLEGFDGELILGDPTAPDAFRKTTSAVMSHSGEPDVTYHVFDCFSPDPFTFRLLAADRKVRANRSRNVTTVEHITAVSDLDLMGIEDAWLKAGYEGVMIRSLEGRYKQGRSTVKEGALLKLKRFVDGEGAVLRIEEQQHNNNEATVNELGRTHRSSHQENKVGAGLMGALVVRNLQTGVEHKVSPGCLTDANCKQIWEERDIFIGRIARFKYFPTGSKDKPRHTQFTGWRDMMDMS